MKIGWFHLMGDRAKSVVCAARWQPQLQPGGHVPIDESPEEVAGPMPGFPG